MIVNVHGGHSYPSPGACGCFDELEQDRIVKDMVVAHLRDAGHTVYDCTDDEGVSMNDNLRRIVAMCNAHSVELDVSIHFNCSNGQGHGTEVHVYSDGSKAKPAAQRIVDNIAALGFANRGVKVSNFCVLRETNAPALLVECCFCDSPLDASIYDVDEMAEAIAAGVRGFESEVPDHTGETVDYIPVDGWLGSMTISRWQQVMGTTVDGVVSEQYYGDRLDLHTTGWDYKDHYRGLGGSELVRAVQAQLGVEVEGFYGTITAKALMARYGVATYREAVLELQRRLNEGTW